MNKKDWEGYIYGLDVAPRGTKLVNFKAVALCLAYHSDWRTLEGMSASMVTIAKETGIGRTTVIKIVAEMLKLGFLVKREEKRVWTKNIWTHIYDLTIPSQEVQLSELPRLTDKNQEVQFEGQEVQNEGQEVQNEGQEVQFEGQEVQLSEHNHTNNHTDNHTSNHTDNHTEQDGNENRGCDGTEPTGTQTASQQLSDSTKEDAHSLDSSEATARAAAAQTSQEATREETEPKDNATASLDLKTNAAESETNAAESDPKTSSAELDSKTGSADSQPVPPTWQEMVDEEERDERLNYCSVCKVKLERSYNKSDNKKWCPQLDCLRRTYDAKEGRRVARTYEIDELVEPKTSAEADELLKTKQQTSEWI